MNASTPSSPSSSWEVGTAPLTDGLIYPGPTPPADAVLIGRDLYPLTRPPGVTELGDWVIPMGGDLVGMDNAFALIGAPPITGFDGDGRPVRRRTPMLAVGSNRSAAQLAAKLDGLPPEHQAMPMMEVRVRGVAITHSAHISGAGYVPYTAVNRSGVHLHWIIWVDELQNKVINGTEPNYTLVAGSDPMVVWRDPQVRIAGWLMYRSRWGALQIPGTYEPIRPGTQEEAYAQLLAEPWFRKLLPSGEMTPRRALDLMAGNPGLREAARDAFVANGAVAEDGLDGLVREILVCPAPRRTTA